jgi:hypothetical protein
LANYYFVTTAGGNITVTLKGSGALWAYVSDNSTLSSISIGSQRPVSLPNNGTFTISLPPNSSFQPIVNAYNTAIAGYDIPDNLSEIIISHNIGGNYSSVNVDGVNITNAQTPEENGWSTFGPVYLGSGAHNLAITNGVNGSFVAMYNIANLTDIFRAKTSIDYNYSTLSETDYNVNINTNSSVFLALSESYYPNWFAYSEGQSLVHFNAFSYSNGFYLNRTGIGDVDVKIEYEPPLLNQICVVQQILFTAIVLFLIATPISRRIRDKTKNRRGD